MSYAFPPDLAALVDRQMKLGSYASEDELLRAALLSLQERCLEDVEEDPEFLAGLARSIEQMKAGQGRPYEEFMVDLRSRTGPAANSL